ncbi:MAG: hypothetical protein Q9172_000520 [Xanthocarpia lactea]
MPFVWSLGSILGPLIGGSLADPCKNYPGIFAQRTLFEAYPFLLPNIVCAMILVVGILIGIFFLEETHQEKRYRRDIGLEAGRKILSLFDRQQGLGPYDKLQDANFEENRLLVEDDAPPGYRTIEGSPRYPSSRSLSPAAPPYTRTVLAARSQKRGVPPSVQTAFTRSVVVHIIGYGILA